jgi:hypothetical protein
MALADAAGLGATSVRGLERGIANPTWAVGDRVARALALALYELVRNPIGEEPNRACGSQRSLLVPIPGQSLCRSSDADLLAAGATWRCGVAPAPKLLMPAAPLLKVEDGLRQLGHRTRRRHIGGLGRRFGGRSRHRYELSAAAVARPAASSMSEARAKARNSAKSLTTGAFSFRRSSNASASARSTIGCSRMSWSHRAR